MIEDIKSGNGLCFGTGKLQELCKMLPDEGEVLELLFFLFNMSIVSLDSKPLFIYFVNT